MKVGFVAVIGKPNVGKTTLINRLVGTKLGAVSPKPQTTRQRILGVLTTREFQIGFLDTPGVLERKINLLHVAMDKESWSTVDQADLVLMITEPGRPDNRDLLIIDRLRGLKKPVLLAINKIDRVPKDSLLPLIDEYSKLMEFMEIIPISAERGDGLDVLLKELLEYLPEGEPLYPEDELSDRDLRFFAGEIIREKIFLRLREELPYSSAVEIEDFKEEEGIARILAIIYVERESQKPIVLGKGGRTIKEIGTLAREELEYLLGKRVYLELRVKVRPGWRKDKDFLKGLGLL
ncbi:MAG: GTPase Era [candidate division WOR-3 bacterium]